jgi:uncharacterized protein (DUF1800 family)
MNLLTTARIGADRIAAIAGGTSYGHQVTLLDRADLGLYAYAVPITVDVLAFIAAMVRNSDVADDTARRAAMWTLLFAGTASGHSHLAAAAEIRNQVVGHVDDGEATWLVLAPPAYGSAEHHGHRAIIARARRAIRPFAGYSLAMADRPGLAHLLRRATFGPTAEEVDAAERVGERATLERLLQPGSTDAGAAATPQPVFSADPYVAVTRQSSREDRNRALQERRRQVRLATEWWLDRLVAAEHQLAEKVVFFWHGHWATGMQKVRSAGLMLAQLRTFRDYGLGDFAALTRAMVHDPALILWLDGQRNTRDAPNENLARELMELFTLGIGSYSEADVREGARALTGWVVNREVGTARFVERRHDGGTKTIFGTTARFDADSYADLLTRHRAGATFLARRFWFRFGSAEPMPARAAARVAAAYRPGRNITALLGALFTDPAFPGTVGQLVKQPVEWAVGATARRTPRRPVGTAAPTAGGRSQRT